MGNIRNPEGYEKSFWDWSRFNNCFYRQGKQTKCRMSDIDGCISNRNHILLIETKKPNEKTGEKDGGQKFMYQAFLKTGVVTVLYLWGENDNPTHWERWYEDGHHRGKQPVTAEEVHDFIKRWWDFYEKTENRKTWIDKNVGNCSGYRNYL